jgi:hypothetical protein
MSRSKGLPKSPRQVSKKKRPRRTRADINQLCDDLLEVVEANRPCTCRQVFYRAVSAGIIPKTEAAYKGDVCRLLAKMRRDGRLDYHALADNTRWQRKPRTHGSLESALRNTAEFYRRDLWHEQDAYVEIWTEKDAMAGVLFEVTSQWHVPLMVSRGFASLTYLYEAAESIKNARKPAYLYYLGDHDPSGVEIDRHIERELRKHAPDCEIHFERIAVTSEQIHDLKLPTRPTKGSDSRAKNFDGESVEVDAIPPAVIRQMVQDFIFGHIDPERLKRLRVVEAAERDTLRRIAGAKGLQLNVVADLLDLE